MNRNRGVVLVSCRRTAKDAEIGIANVHSADDPYVASARAASLLPLLLPVTEDESEIADALALASGVILTGGEDIHPDFFGEEVHPRCGDIDVVRDRFDIALVRAALRARLPLLAICRGVQALNVATGGTLFQDIEAQIPGAIGHRARMKTLAPSHSIALEPGSLLREVAGAAAIAVNSSHHQSVKDVGAGLRVTARSRDGVVEALEGTADIPSFVLGVQFHPERHPEDAFSTGLFRRFAAEVAKAARHAGAAESAVRAK